PGGRVVVLHAGTRAEADSPRFCQPLRWASGVWITGGDQRRFMALYGGTGVQRELVRLYRRGGGGGGHAAGGAPAGRAGVRARGGGGRSGPAGRGGRGPALRPPPSAAPPAEPPQEPPGPTRPGVR